MCCFLIRGFKIICTRVRNKGKNMQEYARNKNHVFCRLEEVFLPTPPTFPRQKLSIKYVSSLCLECWVDSSPFLILSWKRSGRRRKSMGQVANWSGELMGFYVLLNPLFLACWCICEDVFPRVRNVWQKYLNWSYNFLFVVYRVG